MLPEGIVRAAHVTPATRPQVIVTELEGLLLKVMFVLPDAEVPPAPAVVATLTAAAVTVKDAEELEGVTIRFAELDMPPPGAGLNTVIVRVPGLAISAAVTIVLSPVLLLNVVFWEVPLMFICEFETNPVPFTVSENSALPATTLFGVNPVIEGTGLGAWTKKETGLEVPPLGLSVDAGLGGLLTVT